MRTKNPVKYIKKDNSRLGCLKKDRDGEYDYPSAGPYANITGMRKHYWGEDACIIKIGQYIYKVPKEIYEQF